MSSCHSVTIIDEKLSGDPMDVIMLMSTGWVLDEQTKEENSQVINLIFLIKFDKYFKYG